MIELAQWLQSTELSLAIQTNAWITPTLQSIHIVMIAVVFCSVGMIALRVLGLMRADEPFAQVWQRFAPWMWAGLVVLAVTGLLLTVGEPVREVSAKSFWTKMALILVGIATVVSFRRLVRHRPGQDRFVAGSGALAVATLLIWSLIVFFGRAIAYDTEVWAPAAAAVADAVQD